jgi:hypothetical protein
MGRYRVLVALAVALATTGSIAVLSGVGAPAPHRAVTLSSDDRGGHSQPYDSSFDETTTSTAFARATTSTAPVTTTTVQSHAVVTTPTTAAPHATTTTEAPQRTAVIDFIVSFYPAAIDFTIGSDDSDAHWVLEPSAIGSPATIVLGDHDHSGSHVVAHPSCGAGDQDSYFTDGHHYRIKIEENGIADGCGTGIPGYRTILLDVTSGASKTF